MVDNKEKHAIEMGINLNSDSLKQSALEVLSKENTSTHAREHALSPRQFEQLIKATYNIENKKIELESRALIYLAGRIGLRKGEIAHMTSDWFNLTDRSITVPEYERCTKGQHGNEPCGYCRRRAQDRLNANNIAQQDAIEAIHSVSKSSQENKSIDKQAAELVEEVNITFEHALEKQWQPKTPQSARSIPFDFDVRVELALEEWLKQSNGWDNSAATVNRRINRVAEKSKVETRVYPHALRATAASYHASRNISVHSLMSIMGWSDPGTARAYITSNDEQAAREIRSKHR